MTASRGLAASPLWGGSLSPARRVGWGEGLVALDASLAGMCARRRTYFSCTHKKSRQKKAPPSLRPLRCAVGAATGGHPRTGHRCARLRISLPLPHAGEGRGEGARGRAQRWPVWTSTPLWPCREVQGLGRARAAKHACASCSGLLRLSERRERSEQSEFRSAAPRPSIAVARSEAEGHGQWGRLFFGYFLLARQKKVTAPPGAHPGQQRPQPHQPTLRA